MAFFGTVCFLLRIMSENFDKINRLNIRIQPFNVMRKILVAQWGGGLVDMLDLTDLSYENFLNLL